MTSDRCNWVSSSGRRRALGAWLGVIALLLQGLMPVGQAVPFAGAGDRAFLVLCTGHGTRTLPVEPDGSGPENRPWSCPVCQANALGDSLVAPASVVVPAPAYTRAFLAPAAGTPYASPIASRFWHARAPPVV